MLSKFFNFLLTYPMTNHIENLKWKGSRFQHGDVDICWTGLRPGEGWAGHDVLHSAPDPVLGHHHHDQHRLWWHRSQVGNVPQTLDERVVMTTLSAITLTAACSSFVWQVFTSNSGHLLASSWRLCAPSAVFSASHCPSRSLWRTSTGIIKEEGKLPSIFLCSVLNVILNLASFCI